MNEDLGEHPITSDSSNRRFGNSASPAGGLGVPSPTIEVTLPDTEWLGLIVDILLDVSEDIVDKGRDMYSSLSANPTTLGRGTAAGGADEGASGTSTGGGLIGATPASGWEADRVGRGGARHFSSSSCEGVVGKLFALDSFGGVSMDYRSLLETAPERLWAWPRLRFESFVSRGGAGRAP